MEQMRTHVLETDRGEILVEDGGRQDGLAVVVHPGSPGSRLLFGAGTRLAARFGLRLVSFDRPGYGSRPAAPGRTIADSAAETGLIADRLGLERFAVWGFSGGGPYALACAALMPERVVAACVFASPAPYAPEHFDYAEGWSPGARDELQRYFTDRAAARANWRQDAATMLATCSDPEGWLERWGDLADQDPAHSREVAEYLAADVRESLGNGDQGWWDDWVALLAPWGFDLAASRVPVRLWHGTRDRNMPPVHGHRIAQLVPGIQAYFPDEDTRRSRTTTAPRPTTGSWPAGDEVGQELWEVWGVVGVAHARDDVEVCAGDRGSEGLGVGWSEEWVLVAVDNRRRGGDRRQRH